MMLEECLTAAHAIVIVHFSWSGQSFQSLKVLEDLERTSEMGMAFYRFDPDENPDVIRWMSKQTMELPGRGCGSVLWIKSGKIVDWVSDAAKAGLNDLIQRTTRAFPSAPS